MTSPRFRWHLAARAATVLVFAIAAPSLLTSAFNCPGCSSLAAAPSPAGGPAAARTEAAPTEATTRSAVTFDKLIDRVRKLAAPTGPPVDPKDPLVRDALDTLVAEVKAAARRDDLALPVTLDEIVSVTEEARPQDLRPGTLWVCGGGAAGGATRSVILADGSVSVAFANDCVIVARGAVDVAHGSGNVIVAGQLIQVSHDGTWPPGRGARQGKNDGSVLLCGGPIDVGFGAGTTCSSPVVVDMSHANGVTFLNSPKVTTSHQENCTTAKAAALTLAPKEPSNPLAGKIKVTQVIPSDRPGRAGVVVDHGGVELVVRQGKEVRDGAGKPLAELAGWKLSSTGDHFAVFSNGTEDALFLLK